MVFKKVHYVDNATVIGAENMNDIQDAILNAVSTEAQTLTDEQKAQARENIGVHDAIEEYVTEAILGGAW